MNSKNIFRLLLVLIILLDIGYVCIGRFSTLIENEDVKILLEWNEYGAIYNIYSEPSFLVVGIVVLLIVISIISFIGIFLFKRWARSVFLIVNIFFLLFIPFSGILVLLPWENFFYTVTSVLNGGILVMMYLAPISIYFEERN